MQKKPHIHPHLPMLGLSVLLLLHQCFLLHLLARGRNHRSIPTCLCWASLFWYCSISALTLIPTSPKVRCACLAKNSSVPTSSTISRMSSGTWNCMHVVCVCFVCFCLYYMCVCAVKCLDVCPLCVHLCVYVGMCAWQERLAMQFLL